MGFILVLGLLATIAGLLSAAISVPIFRLERSYAKPLAIFLGIVLFVFFSWGGFVILIVEAGRQGHPF